jgi:hypothetical protein
MIESEGNIHPRAGEPGADESQTTINSGVHISGGTVSGPIAAGYRTQAIQINHDAVVAETLTGLDRLLQMLDTGSGALTADQVKEVRADVECVREELTDPNPNSHRIRRLLEQVAAHVSAAAPLLDVVERVRELVAAAL